MRGPVSLYHIRGLTASYDKGYVIASMDYSSVVAQATSATAAPSSISTSTLVSISSASPPSSSSASVSSRQYNLTGGLSDLVQQDFTGGVCNFYYFSAISPEFGFCIGSGSAIFPSSGCSGTACTLDASAPKLGWGLAGDLSLPSNLVCYGSVHTVADGLDIPSAMTAGKGSDPFYVSSSVSRLAHSRRLVHVTVPYTQFPIYARGYAERE